MATIKCEECGKKIGGKEQKCPHCGVPVQIQPTIKQKKWYERTSITLYVAAVLIIIGLGFIHIITGVKSRNCLPFSFALKESFGYREIFINADKIKSMPYTAAKLKYPISCKILQKLGYIATGNVFEAKMIEQLRGTMETWQAEFEENLNKPQQRWQDQLRGKSETTENSTSSAEACNKRGIDAAIAGQYETAISEFARAFRKQPAYADACYNRGLVYIAIGQLGPAVSDFTKTIEIDPDFIDAYLERGNIHVTMRQYDQAISDFTKVLGTIPGKMEVRFKRAFVFFITGQYEKAWEDINKIQKTGISIPSGFLKNLRRASEREK